ncbi:SPOR domain-containing protein [Brachyspira catarrhinii]|uniref:SPOR domain-containing protein n=1 Tax=Brachyspira catarrhinii TaxID=2528966 RepID=A0ABY2TQ55_9SPIR|nr:SPOR domain-containing protein [Brachyspira catarrhinii]
MNENQNQNNVEKDYSINNTNNRKNNFEYGRKKTLYIVNFTPLRLLIFAASSILLVLFIFILGFHLGSSKPNNANSMANNDEFDNNSSQILMRTEELSGNRNFASSNFASSNFESANNDILTLSENTQNDSYNNYNNSSIIRENSTSEDRYNEYTQSLASELDAIIKEKNNLSPNSSYNPPEQFASATPTPVSESSTITKRPYTSTSSADSVYFIQVAVGYDRDNTYSARDNLKSKFPKAFIKEEATSDGKTMYKLKVGRYETREDAQKALTEIKKIAAYKDSYIYSDKKAS